MAEVVKETKCFEGTVRRGLTCTDENFITKAGAQRKAAEKGVALVCPDTSPRGANIEGEDESYDFGSGAGFYVDATEDKWSKHYNMYSYVTKELPSVLSGIKELSDKCSVFGHSMGGHGALICALKNPGKYASVSAFSPIANPTTCPWGEKAFGGYLGSDKSKWHAYDASHLVGEFKSESTLPIFVDQGEADNFLKEGQLQPEVFEKACSEAKSNGANVDLTLKYRPGYDHSYFYIATFVDEHIEFHSKFLGK